MVLHIVVSPNQYYDSVQLLFITSSLRKIAGVQSAFVAMGTPANKATFMDIGMMSPEVEHASPNDMVVGIQAVDQETVDQALDKVQVMLNAHETSLSETTTCATIDAAVKTNPKANFCIISVPSEHAKAESIKALNNGLHVLIFSDNIPLEDEREIKELAVEKGLLCMGPDCGVANINGIAFMTGSIVRKGPVGICAASGAGLQQVSALIHEYGSGVSQGIGTGGKDLKDKVGGLTMLSGIDALERDPASQIIVLISRKPETKTLDKVLERVKSCTKPVVACFMGCTREEIEATGAIWAGDLEDTTRKALGLVGIQMPLPDLDQFVKAANETTVRMAPEQKYVRGLFCGGTYTEEAMVVMSKMIGGIYSNAPLSSDLKLKRSIDSLANTVVDYGDEEFTLGRPHPDFDPEPRGQGIIREAQDPETAVILLDFIIGPGVHEDPAGAIIDQITEARRLVQARGGELAVVATVSGTEDDPQCRSRQEQILREAGVLVCPSNYQAALLAGTMIQTIQRRKQE